MRRDPKIKPYANRWKRIDSYRADRFDGAQVLRSKNSTMTMQWMGCGPNEDAFWLKSKRGSIRRFHTSIGAQIAVDREYPL